MSDPIGCVSFYDYFTPEENKQQLRVKEIYSYAYLYNRKT